MEKFTSGVSTFGHMNPTNCAKDTVHNEINYPIDKEFARYHKPITIYYCKRGQAYGAQSSHCWWCTRAQVTLFMSHTTDRRWMKSSCILQIFCPEVLFLTRIGRQQQQQKTGRETLKNFSRVRQTFVAVRNGKTCFGEMFSIFTGDKFSRRQAEQSGEC